MAASTVLAPPTPGILIDQLIETHNELIATLENKYQKYIIDLLEQKKRIIQEISLIFKKVMLQYMETLYKEAPNLSPMQMNNDNVVLIFKTIMQNHIKSLDTNVPKLSAVNDHNVSEQNTEFVQNNASNQSIVDSNINDGSHTDIQEYTNDNISTTNGNGQLSNGPLNDDNDYGDAEPEIQRVSVERPQNKELKKSKISKKEWKCSSCNYTTPYKHNLRKHIRTHTGEKPFKCDRCGKTFTQNCNLTTHIRRMHTGATPFQCDKCGKRFAQHIHLKLHITSYHHGNDAY